MNLVNVIAQSYLINKFIGGRFWDYGYLIFIYYCYYFDLGLDPMVDVFPKVTKCQFNRHGPGGGINVREIKREVLTLLVVA